MSNYGLVADAGGTNIRFALIDLDQTSPALIAPHKFTSRNFKSIEDAARAYLAEQKLDASPLAAVLSVAGPVSDNAIGMTNLGWRFSGADVAKALNIGSVRLINDYEAIAFSVDALGQGDLRDVGPAKSVRMACRASPTGISTQAACSRSSVLGPSRIRRPQPSAGMPVRRWLIGWRLPSSRRSTRCKSCS